MEDGRAVSPSLSVCEAIDFWIKDIDRKLLEPHSCQCQRDPDCQGHYGQVFFLGLKDLLRDLRDVRAHLAAVEREAAFVAAAKAAFAARAALDPYSSAEQPFPRQMARLEELIEDAQRAYGALALEREA